MSTTLTCDEQLVTDLVHAAFGHGRIISNKRLPEWRELLVNRDIDLAETLDSLVGYTGEFSGRVVVAGDKSRSTYTVAKIMANMVMVYVLRSLEFLARELKPSKGVGDVYARHPTCQKRVRDAAELLPRVMAVHTKWSTMLNPLFVKEIAEVTQSLHDQLGRDGLKKILGDVTPGRLQRWAAK